MEDVDVRSNSRKEPESHQEERKIEADLAFNGLQQNFNPITEDHRSSLNS